MYQVRCEVFEGPIDLLLHLITRRRVDIYEVSLATITEEFLAAVQRLEAADLERATGFLVVAATLLELKSARLLPGREDDPEARSVLEERDLLLARLVASATYAEAGRHIGSRLALAEHSHPRRVALEEPYADLVPDVLERVTLDDVAAAAARVLATPPEPPLDVSHIAPIRVSVRDAIAEVAARLRGGQTSFVELCAGVSGRLDVVVRFLALLELYKAGAVEIEQAERFGDIVTRWTGEVGVDEVIAQADGYAGAREAPGERAEVRPS